MTISIGSNILSKRTLRQLDLTSQKLNKNFERLSSGQRINHAADDAAGLAVSESLRVGVAVKNRALLNVNDGISVTDLVGGAANSISSLLTRMAELAQQSANGSLGSSQRVVLNKEYSELDKEIRRIAATTEFNGIKLLAGTKSNRALTNATNVSGGVTNVYSSSGDGRYLTTYNSTAGTIEQLDSETGSITTIATGVTQNQFARSSASGERVVFQAQGSVSGANPGSGTGLFLYDRNTQSITRIAALSGADRIRELAFSADGSTVAFRSDTQFNANGSVFLASTPAIHTYNIANGVIERLNYTVSQNSSTLAISADGSYVTFGEQNNLLGTNADGNIELYSFRVGSAATTLKQVTSVSGLSSLVIGSGHGITNTGDIYFVSTANYVAGNGSNRNQVFKYNNQTSRVEQLTKNSSASTFDSLTITNDVSQILFRTNANLTGENSTGSYQIYKFDLLANSFGQVTNYTDATLNSGSSFSISNDGNTFYSHSTQLRAIDISAGDFNLNIEAGAGSLGSISTALEAINGTLRGLGSHALTTQSAARGALDAILLNIQKLGSLQGVIGAGQSRLQTAAKLLLGQRQETAAARSRITDIDVAEEAASANRHQILQQAATAVLAQANLQPEIALTLLQG